MRYFIFKSIKKKMFNVYWQQKIMRLQRIFFLYLRPLRNFMGDFIYGSIKNQFKTNVYWKK
jgi:hypothetical protein